MKIRTNVKAGGIWDNHNETQIRTAARGRGMRVRTGLKAGGSQLQHNETLARIGGR